MLNNTNLSDFSGDILFLALSAFSLVRLLDYPFVAAQNACGRAIKMLVWFQDATSEIHRRRKRWLGSPPGRAASLPPEVYLLIFKFLAHRKEEQLALQYAGLVCGGLNDNSKGRAVRDLRACILTCRAWRGPATDALYSRLEPRDEHTWKLLIRSLLSSQAANPDVNSYESVGLAGRIQSFVAPATMRADRFEHLDSLLSSCKNIQRAGLVIGWSGVPLGVGSMDSKDGEQPALMQVAENTIRVLNQLPSLRSLKVDAMRYTTGRNVVPLMVKDNLLSSTMYHIRDLELCNLSWRFTTNDFLQHSDIEATEPSNLPNLRTLTIRCCSLGAEWLRQLAEAAPGVETLTLIDTTLVEDDEHAVAANMFCRLDKASSDGAGEAGEPCSLKAHVGGWSSSLRKLTLAVVRRGLPSRLRPMSLPQDLPTLSALEELTVDGNLLDNVRSPTASELRQIQTLKVIWRGQPTSHYAMLAGIASLTRTVDRVLSPGPKGCPKANLRRVEVSAFVGNGRSWRDWEVVAFLFREYLQRRGVELVVDLCFPRTAEAELRRRWSRRAIFRRLMWQY